MAGLSLRQVEWVLTRLGEWFGFDAPDFSTVRLWVLRVGLALWQRARPHADDWIWLVDHVAEAGGGKCLVIVGVRRSWLGGRDLVLRHTDVTLLYAEVMPTSTGDGMHRRLDDLATVVGVPVQIVSDHGSDLLKGTRLFQSEHPATVLTWDITHRLARLLLASVKGHEPWTAFRAACQRARTAVERTPWSPLSPPSTTGASRCEHIDTLALWGERTLAALDRGGHAVLDGEHGWDQTAAAELQTVLPIADRQRLDAALLDQSFPDAASFRTAVRSLLGPSEHEAAIAHAADQGLRRCRAHFGWLEPYRSLLREECVPLVRMTYSAEKQVKSAGLHGRSAAEWLASQPPLPRSQTRARQFRASVLRYLREEGRQRPRTEALLSTTDVLESLFGKYKRYTERSPSQELNSAILTLPLATEPITRELVEAALDSTPIKSLKHWVRATFVQTKLALQRLVYAPPLGTESA
jgi:hypothetical protein